MTARLDRAVIDPDRTPPPAAYRAALLHMRDRDDVEYHEDGLLVVADGAVTAFGAFHDLAPGLPDGITVEGFPGKMILPGFVDSHVHFAQTDAIASHGKQLLDWLDTHIFPTELGFADSDHAAAVAAFFLDELLRNGTTAALVFSTVHAAATDALFAAALARNMRIISGKTLMDRNAPDGLRDDPARARSETVDLIRRWHGRGRLGYAVTPRFAIACTPEELSVAGEIVAVHDDVLMHTHLSENRQEIAFVADLFPDAADYLDVYRRHGLLTARSVLAHGCHLDRSALRRLADAGAGIAHCPDSNMFLGSGLFPLATAIAEGVEVGLGTDIGAGTSFSMLRMMDAAYKTGQLLGAAPDPLQALYHATLGGARLLGIGDRVGNLAPGKEADFIVVDPAATPLLARRTARCTTLAERLFALSVLGDDRAIARTYVAGRLAHVRGHGVA